ncbi:MAG: Smr/MutS family protein [Deltaproteobacteria bacterium]|nr:Smr/MutS family protein [Deltaproteobacteria bacterium]
MVKKRKTAKSQKQKFNNDPFGNLKGFAVSTEDSITTEQPKQQQTAQKQSGSFEDEMALLGVQPLGRESDAETESPLNEISVNTPQSENTELSDADLFLTAMNSLQVDFTDQIPDDEEPIQAIPRRMSQIKKGRLSPQATIDLHGCLVSDVVPKLNHFLQNAQYQGWLTVLVITGKGLHSVSGEAVLRLEAERFISNEGRTIVAEWGRAPKHYGGEGALVLFLRKKS